MKKVGQGHIPPHMPSAKKYHKMLEQEAKKFLRALESYNRSSGEEEKNRLRATMDMHLGLIESSVNELKRAGIHKQEEKLKKDFRLYLETPTSQNYAVLRHDLTTLCDYT